jgi:hypothetical protein
MHRTAVALALLLLAGTGCGKGEVVINTKNSKGESVQVKAGATGTVSLPANFPKDVGIPKDSTVAVSMTQGKDLMVTFRVKGTIEATLASYQESMKSGGWTLKEPMNMNGSFMLEGKKEKRTCVVMIMAGEAGEIVAQVHTSPE